MSIKKSICLKEWNDFGDSRKEIIIKRQVLHTHIWFSEQIGLNSCDQNMQKKMKKVSSIFEVSNASNLNQGSFHHHHKNQTSNPA